MSTPAEMSRAERALAEASTVGDVKKVYDIAEAYRVFSSSADEQNKAATLKLRAAAKGGRILAALPKRRNQWSAGDSLSQALGIESEEAARQLSSRWQRVADLDEAGTLGDYLDGEPDEVTMAGLLRYLTDDGDLPGDEWYTPAWLFDALGLRFNLDVCAPVDRTHVTTPAKRFYTELEDGLVQPWNGLVWCNPPYSNPTPWAERMVDHDNGILLSHVPINGLWCLRAWNACQVLRLLQGMEFVRPTGEIERPAYWLQLVAFGDTAAKALRTMDDRLDPEVRERFRPSRVLA